MLIQQKMLRITTLILFLFIIINLCTAAYADNLGVNYDPATHSLAYARAIGFDDEDGMRAAIWADLDKLAELQQRDFSDITHLKVFYTIFASSGLHSKMVKINIADVVHDWNVNHNNKIKLALGIYEFRPGYESCKADECIQWTHEQIEGAITAANKYGSDLIDNIIVGNENLNGHQWDADELRPRILEDISYLKQHLPHSTIKVGIADTPLLAEDLLNPLSSGHYLALEIKNSVDFIGVNIYPFWANQTYGDAPFDHSAAKDFFFNEWNKLQTQNALLKDKKELIVTEEGWPSNSEGFVFNSAPIPGLDKVVPTIDRARDYFYFWHTRNSYTHSNHLNGNLIPLSYYFALFDRYPSDNVESHWGIFSADGNSSLLDMQDNDFSQTKSLSPNHPIVTFKNKIESKNGFYEQDPTHVTPRRALLLSCMEDFKNNDNKINWKMCYPLYGRVDVQSEIGLNQDKKILLDISGNLYQSLQVAYYDYNNELQSFCHINHEALSQLNRESTVTLSNVSVDANGNCDVSKK